MISRPLFPFKVSPYFTSEVHGVFISDFLAKAEQQKVSPSKCCSSHQADGHISAPTLPVPSETNQLGRCCILGCRDMMAYRQEGIHSYTHTHRQEAMPGVCVSHDPPVMWLTRKTSVLSSLSDKALQNEQHMGYKNYQTLTQTRFFWSLVYKSTHIQKCTGNAVPHPGYCVASAAISSRWKLDFFQAILWMWWRKIHTLSLTKNTHTHI